MALVGLAIKLALINGTPVFPFMCFVALRFFGVPFAIWIVRANELIDFGGAWNDAFVVLGAFATAFAIAAIAFASDTDAGAGEQYDKGGKGGDVLQHLQSTLHHHASADDDLDKAILN